MNDQQNISKAERTRQFIIEKTAPIFNTKGYAGTSLNDMTEATGLTKGSIYGNFANKDEVALAVFDYNLKKVNGIRKVEMSKLDSYKEKLLVYTNIYQNFLSHPFTEGGCPILNTAVEADDTHPLLRKKAAEGLLAWKNTIVDLVEKGKTAGEFKADTKPEQVAVTMLAMIEGGIMISRLLGKKSYLMDVLASVSKFVEDLT